VIPCIIEGKSYPLHRTTRELPPLDPLAWLHAQPLYPKLFWKEKGSSVTRAAVGATLLFKRAPLIHEESDPEIRLYGGCHFAPPQTTLWECFPEALFWLPQVEITCLGRRTLVHSYDPDYEMAPPEALQTREGASVYRKRWDTPSREEWEELCQSTLNQIQSGEIEKLVLSRRTSFSLSSPLSPWHILPSSANATVFAFQMTPHTSFLGATPELLFRQEGPSVWTEAVAGTRIDQEPFTDKERREFLYVKRAEEEILRPYASSLQWKGEDQQIGSGALTHLYNELHAKLHSPLSPAQLLSLLHPTPALGGYPKSAALSLLSPLEHRGWYGAPIGVLSTGKAHFYVAIRSMLLRKKEAHLFAGAGIVEGSSPQREWEELEAKIAPLVARIKRLERAASS
jgi:menaquinone-specific isochorismate synthase